MTNNIDHYRLFKELISTFFVEFIELFFPQLMDYLDRDSITFLDKEVFTDVTEGEKHESDLVAQVRFRGKESFFLIHLEAQESSRKWFNRRMFTYFARFHEKFVLPIYPIIIFSYSWQKKEAISQYVVDFPDFKVLEFNYQVVQLNRLNWRDFLNQPNPVASALMAKMNIAKKERAKVKAECLRLLITLRLNPAKMQLISGFIDTYLNLNPVEEIQFQEEISTFSQPVQEGNNSPKHSNRIFRFLIQRQWGNMEAITDYGSQQAKIVVAERGYDWDTMTEEEKEEFIDKIVQEPS